MKVMQCCLGLVLVLIPHVRSTFYKEAMYEVTSLADEDINVAVRSEMPTNLKWIFTEEDKLTVFLRISAVSYELIEQTNIFLESNSSACAFLLSSTQIADVAAVTGAGNRNGHVFVIISLLLMILDWRCIHVLILILIVNGLVQCMAQTPMPNKYDRHVKLEVRAPRRLRYKDISLVVQQGHVRFVNTSLSSSTRGLNICSVEFNECQSCCHGHGICTDKGCVCDQGFDPKSNCSLKTRKDILFSHALDPRLLRTVTPSGDVITLHDISNSANKLGKLKDSDHLYLDMKSLANQTKIYLSVDGFIKKMVTEVDKRRYSIHIKRSRDTPCRMTLTAVSENGVKIVYDVNNCYNVMNIMFRKSLHLNKIEKNKTKTNHDDTVRTRPKRFHTRRSDRTSVYIPVADSNYVDILVKALRCASEVTLDYTVSFEMISKFKTNTDTKSITFDNISTEVVYLRTKVGNDKKRIYLQLPNSQVQEVPARTQKCEHVIKERGRLCRPESLNITSQICDSLIAQTAFNSTIPLPVIFIKLCKYVYDVIEYFCDDILNSKQENNDADCMTMFPQSVDLFSSPNYSIRPIVTFTDGKRTIGHWIDVSTQSLERLRKTGITVRDDKPEVKVVSISVIPNDPAPQDIYQVKLDYICATNQTVIQMNVIGSDLYKNHVTCTGITECNCCSLHAAGASNSVVDHVTINITDPLTGVEIFREMVVII